MVSYDYYRVLTAGYDKLSNYFNVGYSLTEQLRGDNHWKDQHEYDIMSI